MKPLKSVATSEKGPAYYSFCKNEATWESRVIRALQNEHTRTLMRGDGGNDVGALKQADVGIALLSGYGNVNTSNG